MKRYDIDKIFARMLNEYLNDGYVINTNTMGGHQGEIAKVDLMKDGVFLRMNLERGNDWKKNCDSFILTVGKTTRYIRTDRYETVWNRELEEVDRHVFWQIGEDWYTGIWEYAEACSKKREARFRASYTNVDPLTTKSRDLPDVCRKIVLNRVRSLPRCKSVKLSDIKKVRRSQDYDGGVRYVADVRDTSVTVGKVFVA